MAVEMRINKQSIIELIILIGAAAIFGGSFFYAFKFGIVAAFVLIMANSVLWFYRCQALYNKFNLLKAPKKVDEKEQAMKELLYLTMQLNNKQNVQTAISEVKKEQYLNNNLTNLNLIKENEVKIEQQPPQPPTEPEKIEIKEEREFL